MNLAVNKRRVWNLSGKEIGSVGVDVVVHELRMTNASGELSSILEKAARCSPELQYLNVSSCSLIELGLDFLCQVISKNSLCKFEAANMRDMTVKDMTTILNSLNTKCREINIENCVFMDGNFSDFSLFSKFVSLEKLSLAHWEVITDGDMSHLPSTLKGLNISGTKPLTSFAFLSQLPLLIELDLDGVRLTDSAQDKLVDALMQKKDMRIRINLDRLPAERALSPDRIEKIPKENKMMFY